MTAVLSHKLICLLVIWLGVLVVASPAVASSYQDHSGHDQNIVVHPVEQGTSLMNHLVEQMFGRCNDASGHCDISFIEPNTSSASPVHAEIRTAAGGIFAAASGPLLKIYRPPKD